MNGRSMRLLRSQSRRDVRGFSLVELAIVLIVLAVLARASLVPLAALDASRRERHAERDIAMIRDALVAHLVSHGELPCPLDPVESSSCRVRGHVPAAVLGLDMAVDGNGAALDPWANPYRYALGDSDFADGGVQGAADWSSAEEIAVAGIGDLRGSLAVCREARDPCVSTDVLAEDLVFVIASLGADTSAAGLQVLNRAENGYVFTRASPSTVDAYRYDDKLAWLSRSEAVWWLLRAQRLP